MPKKGKKKLGSQDLVVSECTDLEPPPAGYDAHNVKVTVMVMSGDQLDFDIMSDSHVKDIKEVVEDKWSILASCQRLASDSGVLADHEYIGKHCLAAQPELNITLVKSLEKLYDRHPLELPEIDALRDMGFGNEDAIRTLTNGFHRKRKKGRRKKPWRHSQDADGLKENNLACYNALLHLAKLGETHVPDAFLKSLSNTNNKVRGLAISALGQTCKGNAEVFAKLMEKLDAGLDKVWAPDGDEDRDWFEFDEEGCYPVVAAAEALGKVAEPGQVDASGFFTTALGRMQMSPEIEPDEHFFLLALLDSLVDVMKPADAALTKAASKSLAAFMERWTDGQKLALRCAARIFPDPSKLDIEEFRTLLTHPSRRRRAAAVSALAAICPRGDLRIVSLSLTLMDHHIDLLREVGLRLATKFAPFGDALMLSKIRSLLDDPASSVIRAAFPGLAQLAIGEDKQTHIDILIPFLDHRDPWVRAAVPGALVQLGGESVLQTLVSFMDRADTDSLLATIKSLGSVCFSSDEQRLQPIPHICDRLKHQDPYVRRAVLVTLPKLLPNGDTVSVKHLKDALLRWNETKKIRQCIADLLVRFAEDGANEEARAALQDAIDGDGKEASQLAYYALHPSEKPPSQCSSDEDDEPKRPEESKSEIQFSWTHRTQFWFAGEEEEDSDCRYESE